MNLELVDELKDDLGILSLNINRGIVENRLFLNQPVLVRVTSGDINFLAEMARALPEPSPLLTAVVKGFAFSSRLILFLKKIGFVKTVITDMPSRLSSHGIIFSCFPSFKVPGGKGPDKPSIFISRYNAFCARALCRGIVPSSFDDFVGTLFKNYYPSEGGELDESIIQALSFGTVQHSL